jgi:hypothetical protein
MPRKTPSDQPIQAKRFSSLDETDHAIAKLRRPLGEVKKLNPEHKDKFTSKKTEIEKTSR